MNLPDLKDLDKVITLCRKRGVKTIKIDNVEITLTDDAPLSNYKKAKASEPTSAQGQIESDSISPEELLFWSSNATSEIPVINQEVS